MFAASQASKAMSHGLIETKTLCGLKWMPVPRRFSATGRKQIGFLPLPSLPFFLLQERVMFYD